MTRCHTVINGVRCSNPRRHIEARRDHMIYGPRGRAHFPYNYRPSPDAPAEKPKKKFVMFGPGWRDRWLSKLPWTHKTHIRQGMEKVHEKRMSKHDARQMKKNFKRVRNVVNPPNPLLAPTLLQKEAMKDGK